MGTIYNTKLRYEKLISVAVLIVRLLRLLPQFESVIYEICRAAQQSKEMKRHRLSPAELKGLPQFEQGNFKLD
ncbi:MAG: hypothetical protein EAZ24_13340 [Burkholderiales bacterium]|nr:MAG: hypothetical protein EAZ24_13340 [Burkholderiales bacterium]